MNRIHGICGGLFAIMVAAGFGITPSPVRSQEQARGEFNLSQKVHWGNAVLPSGEYTYSLDPGGQPAIVRVFQKGGSFSGLFLPQTFSKVNYSGPSRIVLERKDGEVFVASLYVGSLGEKLNFISSVGDSDAGMGVAARETVRMPQPDPSAETVPQFFTILNPNKENVPIAEAQKIYLMACAEVEKKLNWATPIRPKLVLHLGAQQNLLHFPGREVWLKKWDGFRFAEAVVDLALYDLVPIDERIRLSGIAVDKADSTVSLCDLKHCAN